MAVSDLIIPFDAYDCEQPVADIEAVRQINPQRGDAEQLTAIVYDNYDEGISVGFKDVTDQEFWCAGHMPGMPIMPGVIMCESAAQVCSYHVQRHDLMGAQMMGFGGMDEGRFRGVVRRGQRLTCAVEKLSLRRGALIKCRFQMHVDRQLVCDGKIIGVPIPNSP